MTILIVACLNGDWAWKGHCQWEEKSLANNINMNIRSFEIVSNPHQRRIHLYYVLPVSPTSHVHTAKDLTVNATLRLKVQKKFKTCNSAETRRGNQTNAELMLCTFIAQVNTYKQTIIFNKRLYDVYCRKWCLIFQGCSLEGGALKSPLRNLLKLLCQRGKLLQVKSGKQVWCCCWKNILIFI